VVADERVLVRVCASSVNRADWHRLRGWPRLLRPIAHGGVRRPKEPLLGGADRVVDDTRDDVTRSRERYDLVLDVAGGHSWFALRRVLAPRGRLVVVGAHGSHGQLRHIATLRLASIGSRRKSVFFVAKFEDPDLQTLANLLADGRLTPVIDRTYPLADAASALRTMGEGHVRGKLVVTI
jgi:NADPH:quinone reductase-like Zn-dependent oxidoreductase